jgi:hypothetical protein
VAILFLKQKGGLRELASDYDISPQSCMRYVTAYREEMPSKAIVDTVLHAHAERQQARAAEAARQQASSSSASSSSASTDQRPTPERRVGAWRAARTLGRKGKLSRAEIAKQVSADFNVSFSTGSVSAAKASRLQAGSPSEASCCSREAWRARYLSGWRRGSPRGSPTARCPTPMQPQTHRRMILFLAFLLATLAPHLLDHASMLLPTS